MNHCDRVGFSKTEKPTCRGAILIKSRENVNVRGSIHATSPSGHMTFEQRRNIVWNHVNFISI